MNHIYYDVQVDTMPANLQPSTSIENLLAFQVRGQQFGRENDIIERFNKLQRESTFHKLDRTSHLDIFAKPSPEPLTTVDTSTNNTTYIPTITSTPAVTTTTPVVEDKYAISMSYQNSIEEQETTAYFSPPELVKKNSYNVVEDFTARQDKLDKMVQTTGQAVDVCHFYLEMVDWDFDSAVQMFGSLSANNS